MGLADTYLLLVGVSDPIARLAEDQIKPNYTKRITSDEEFIEFLDSPEAKAYHVALVGSGLREIQVIEIAQSLRGVMVDGPIFYFHESPEVAFDRKNNVKNGFTDAFLFPLEHKVISTAFENILAKHKNVPIYRPVKIIDILVGEVLGFDIYLLLPANHKYIKYSSAGQTMDAAKVKKLKAYNHQFVFVLLEQMPKFYQYSASKLNALSSPNGGMGEMERNERLQEAVRDLVSGIFSTGENMDFEEGRRMMADAGEIVKSYLTLSSQSSLYERLARVVGDNSSFYSHLTNVSTIAAIFSLVTNVGRPEDLAIAGLFHDIGLSQVSSEIQLKPESAWTPEEREEYYRHPEHSVNLIKNKKIVLPQHIQTIILQHHERVGGSGHPLGISEPKLKRESQILALADEFDELTKFEVGRSAVSPHKAIQIIKDRGGFSFDILHAISKIFPKTED